MNAVNKILRNILHFYPYKINHVQEFFFSSDQPAKKKFPLEFLAFMEVDKEWPWKILWTDETHFHLTGYVNTRNCRMSITENPLEFQPMPLHPAKVTVWCGFTAPFIIETHFFEETSA